MGTYLYSLDLAVSPNGYVIAVSDSYSYYSNDYMMMVDDYRVHSVKCNSAFGCGAISTPGWNTYPDAGISGKALYVGGQWYMTKYGYSFFGNSFVISVQPSSDGGTTWGGDTVIAEHLA